MTSDGQLQDVPQTSTGALSESNFVGEVVRQCEDLVGEYRKGEQLKSNTIARIYDAMLRAGLSTEEMLHAREVSFASFVKQVDEIECLCDLTAGRPSVRDITIHTLDASHPPEPPASRGRSRDASRDREHRRKHTRSLSSSTECTDRKSKKPFDETILLFVTNRQSSITTTDLRPEVRETLRCKSIYAQDVASSKQSLICQPDCSQIPDPVWNDILLGKFVDLDQIFSALHSIEGDNAETYKVGDLELSTGPSKPKKHISTSGK
ncbi:hypothetical protein BDY19DRAFT_996617 [Irpex rosettiformis]|uniref:Uncharacterized protein n=1 Tax=Irpex rosettiformis TaxID=378272 RepID=A0ACB8TUI3_9APHY|nr:hypothetical protein BDY19DRAFT_996617 [Irpex rosettiformis]